MFGKIVSAFTGATNGKNSTVAGVALIIAAVAYAVAAAFDGDETTTINWVLLGAQLTAGYYLIMQREDPVPPDPIPDPGNKHKYGD